MKLTLRKRDRLLYWIAAALLLIGFGLGDSAVVAWSASMATTGQVAAFGLAFVLTASGVFFTFWEMRRLSSRR
jgi:hypothetical protein